MFKTKNDLSDFPSRSEFRQHLASSHNDRANLLSERAGFRRRSGTSTRP